MRRVLVLSLCLLLSGVPVWVSAQDPAPTGVGAGPAQPASRDRGYAGVVPGRANAPGHLRGRPGATPTVVTWPGFQPRADGASRFFLQLTSRAQYEVRSEPGRVVVTLRGVRIPDRQTRRVLDTRFFDTPVARARTERRGRRDVAFVFEMRADATPVVSLDVAADGYTFVYVEFPAGNWLPPEAQQPITPVGQLSVVSTGSAPSAPPSSNAPNSATPNSATPSSAEPEGWTDPERPPGFGGTTSRRGPQ